MLRRLHLRGGRPLEQMGVSLRCVPRYQNSRDGVVFAIANLHLTALDFWILSYSVSADGTETCVSRPVVSASIPQKPLSLAFQIP